MSEESIQVNFGKPIALFPLNKAVLLPQQVLPLHIFEPRYRQMIARALDGSGQIAMAVFAGNRWRKEYHARPPLRPAVCIGQIIEHERLPGGEFNILVQGVCRARIVEELPPSSERLFRAARVEPVGIDSHAEAALEGVRERLTEMLAEEPLSRLIRAEWVVKNIQNSAIPTEVILELVSFALPTSSEGRYKLLAEGDAGQRAGLVEHELRNLQRLIRTAAAQHPEAWPKGCSWN
ncbi:MAG: LON peptidase substrate-binding domain-containing protein [Phycisphaeraceae bacterium]|nr:LON peptidase substrate-binding domain-containing protein [Phycisphaeraceae bacterium]